MAKIRCDAHECKYNNKDFCIKEGIYVRNDTFCESYKKGMVNKTFLFEFAMYEDDEKKIKCDACDCLHNKDKKCSAHCIKVSKDSKECKTFYKEKKEEN
jgi:hypothetical protein